MNKKIFIPFLGVALLAAFIIISSCQKDAKPVEPKVDYSFVQEFDSMEGMLHQGWVAKNNSRPLGTSTWATGQYSWSASCGTVSGYPGASTSHSGIDYVLCNFSAQGDPAQGQPKGEASCWLISPAVPMKDGDIIKFWSRTLDCQAQFKDRMEFRINPNNSSVEVGNDSSTVGDFTLKAIVINPNLTATGYPGGDPPPVGQCQGWTQYTYTISGAPIPKLGRFAFRYYTPDAGNAGANGQGVAVDKVEFISKYIP